MTRVSIIIPVYNVEQYIAECLESVMAQTYDHGMMECILVDDCSPDHSMDVAKQVIEDYQGKMSIKMLRHDVNRGLSASRNTGIEAATGDYIFFVDSDDKLYPQTIQLLTDQLVCHPNADLIVGNWYDETRGCNNNILKEPMWSKDANHLFLGNTKKITAWNSLIRRSLLIDNNLRFTEGMYFEDVPFNYLLFNLISEYVIIPEVTYFYRKNSGGIMFADRYNKCGKTARDYCKLLHIIVKNHNKKLYVGQSNIIFYYILIIKDYLNNYWEHINDADRMEKYLRRVVRIMIKRHFKNIRPFMILEYTFCYYPALLKSKWVRRHINTFTHVCCLPALLTDKLNKK